MPTNDKSRASDNSKANAKAKETEVKEIADVVIDCDEVEKKIL